MAGLRYSQSKYGLFRYGASESGFQFKIQLSDSSGNVVALLNNEVKELTWTYNRVGGCKKFNMVLKRKYDVLTNLTASDYASIYDLQVYITSGFGGSSTLYYRGMIQSIRPSLIDAEEVVVSGIGYGDRLTDLQCQDGTGAPKIYTSKTITQVVNSLLSDFVTGNTPITSGTIDTFSTSIASIKFNGTVKEALDKLASFVDAEWGVDRNLELYFVAKSTAVTDATRWKIGYDISQIEDEFDYSQIVNRVYIEGGDISGVPYRYVSSDSGSITLYGLREKRVSNSSVVDATVAATLANSILERYKTYLRNSRLTLPFNKSLIESSVPLPLAGIIKAPKLGTRQYATFKYGTGNGTYCGETTYKIESIEYTLKDVSLETRIELNEGKPDFTDQFELLQFQLEQERQDAGV